MKKTILLGLALCMVGCRESNTSLDKNLFNTASDKCKDHLRDSLKSPSSLKISQIFIATNIAKVVDIYSVFGNYITFNGLIKDKIKEEKRRFRDLIVDIDYEAHNSFGTSLRGLYQCKYIFMLERNETSPKPLNTYLYKINSDGKYSIFDDHLPIASFSGSKFFLNSDIKKIVGAKDSYFTKLDEENYKGIEDHYSSINQQDEADRLKKSWNNKFVY